MKRLMQRLIPPLLILATLPLAALAQVHKEQPPGSMTCSSAAILAADTAITLTKPSSVVAISLSSGSSAIYLNLNNTTATSANAIIPGGGSFVYQGYPISGFHYLGAGTTGTISVIAH